jgi:outer membrane protein assembly factor BamA
MILEKKIGLDILTIIAAVMMVCFSLALPLELFSQEPDSVTNSNYTKPKDLPRIVYKWLGRQQNTSKIPLHNSQAVEKFIPYSGKTINRIEVVILEPFGYSVSDSLIRPNRVEKFGNSLHKRTWKKVVLNNLLFNEGDVVQPIDFVENEQLLRELSVFEDVNIVLKNLPGTDLVNVKVIVKDKFTTSIGVAYTSPEKMKYALGESNFIGLGLKAKAIAYFDKAYENPWGYQGEFHVPNYFGSYIGSNFFYRYGHGYNAMSASLNRDFFASKTKFAGGIKVANSLEPYKIFNRDSFISINYHERDFWIGRSFSVTRFSKDKAPYNLVVALRYYQKDFLEGLQVSMYENPYFHSSKNYLISLGLSNQNIYRSSLYFGFGITEDIPVGFKIQFTSGIQQSSFQRRFLVGAELSAAEITPIGYLYLSSRLGGYMAEGAKFEQAAINIRAQYFSNIYRLGRTDIRQYVRYDFTRGAARFKGEREYVVLNRDYGIRGLRSPSLFGETRLMLNFETIFFSPHYIYGFRPAFFVFADFGLVGSADELVYANPLYSAFGVGVRFKNESLIFPAFIVRLAYYPRIPINADVAYWYLSTESRRRFEQFRIREPYIFQYE